MGRRFSACCLARCWSLARSSCGLLKSLLGLTWSAQQKEEGLLILLCSLPVVSTYCSPNLGPRLCDGGANETETRMLQHPCAKLPQKRQGQARKLDLQVSTHTNRLGKNRLLYYLRKLRYVQLVEVFTSNVNSEVGVWFFSELQVQVWQ